jgi:hypothetical protein
LVGIRKVRDKKQVSLKQFDIMRIVMSWQDDRCLVHLYLSSETSDGLHVLSASDLKVTVHEFLIIFDVPIKSNQSLIAVIKAHLSIIADFHLAKVSIVFSAANMKHLKVSLSFLNLLIANILSESERKFAVVVDENIENCAPPEKDAKAIDISKFEFIALTDLDVFINGSIKFLKPMEGLNPLHVYLEKFHRNKWFPEVFNAKRPDFCMSFKRPSEAWYAKTKRLKGCPLKAGVRNVQDSCGDLQILQFQDEFVFNMEPVFDLPYEPSAYFVGKWRMTIQIKMKEKEICLRFFGDVVEI